MKLRQQIKKPLLFTVAAIALLGCGTWLIYWRINQRQWCVQFASDTSQEVTYSRGCVSPGRPRFKKWVITT
jgi:hypothetical protein